jgi:phosphoglycerate dehydrogenase-like enzyme
LLPLAPRAEADTIGRMRSVITVHPGFEATWPWTADHLHALWQAQGPVEFLRTPAGDNRPVARLVADPAGVTRLVVLGTPVTPDCVKALSGLAEVAVCEAHGPAEIGRRFADRGVAVHAHENEGYWGQSVAEFALALTLCGLRRIPQNHHAIIGDLKPWDYSPATPPLPGGRGHQFGDDARFVNGTIQGKQVRVVGAGNVASRFAAFAHALGGTVAAWDPFASEPCFHRAGARREHHLERLVAGADIFAPIVPLTQQTEGLVTAKLIDALPQGCLVVLVTRANVCDMKALRRRVLADELALAADVFDLEPLPLKDPLLGRHNVVHTPHSAGRTRQANEEFAARLAEKFRPLAGA